jgi:hypothetical protein
MGAKEPYRRRHCSSEMILSRISDTVAVKESSFCSEFLQEIKHVNHATPKHEKARIISHSKETQNNASDRKVMSIVFLEDKCVFVVYFLENGDSLLNL